MSTPRSPHQVVGSHTRLRHLTVSAFALALAAGLATPAFATIDNTATATGTPPTGGPITDASNLVQVPVAPADAQLVVTKNFVSLNDVVDAGVYDAGDTIFYDIVVQNTGTITMYNVLPSETANGAGITFNGQAGTGSFTNLGTAQTIAPGGSYTFTNVTYTLSNEDAYNAVVGGANSVDNTASAVGNIGSNVGTAITGADVTNDNVTSTIPETPRIEVTKAATLVKGGGNSATDAEEGDTIEYVYTVNNTGNTVLTSVSVTDDHENGGSGAVTVSPGSSVTSNTSNETLVTAGPVGTNATGTANDGTWATMTAGSTVTFEYDHTVTQAEFNDQ